MMILKTMAELHKVDKVHKVLEKNHNVNWNFFDNRNTSTESETTYEPRSCSEPELLRSRLRGKFWNLSNFSKMKESNERDPISWICVAHFPLKSLILDTEKG